jgi:hypothetical protein
MIKKNGHLSILSMSPAPSGNLMTFTCKGAHINYFILISVFTIDYHGQNEEEKGSRRSTREQEQVRFQEFEALVRRYCHGQSVEGEEVTGIYASGNIFQMRDLFTVSSFSRPLRGIYLT